MPKRPFFESAIHHVLLQAKAIADSQRIVSPEQYRLWKDFINSTSFHFIDSETIRVDWTIPKPATYTFSIKNVKYYTRGDTEQTVNQQTNADLVFQNDRIYQHNAKHFNAIVKQMAKKAGIKIQAVNGHSQHDQAKIHDEEELSDHWAESVNPADIDVIQTNTAITSPELRYIHRTLGNIHHKKVLDVGSGLGEASIYFALRGAKVTAVDLSQPMLSVTQELAKRYNVHVHTVQAPIEHLSLQLKDRFDIVYVGNVFHHVDMIKAVQEIKKILHPNGILVLWEPVDYNPIINIYRKMANKVRSHDEQPFRMKDIQFFQSEFKYVTIRWFWLTTLLLFIFMYLSGKDPNKERYWKSIIKDEKKWKPLYLPLERLDNILLSIFPFLGPLSWNVCLICQNTKSEK